MEKCPITKEDRVAIFKIASASKHFEDKVFELVQKKVIKIPVYLSSGQEFISASLAYEYKNIVPYIFAQHRGHSTYLSFGGNPSLLIKELLGREDGCSSGMGGSASIQSKEISMFGHDGLMGSQIPIAVGACFSSGKRTIAICGDASAEEDYVMSAIAWAGTKKLRITFIVEDNNLSILTEKKVRRSWEMDVFARSVGVNALSINDSPNEIISALREISEPRLLNIKTDRKFWHCGAGNDNPDKEDRYSLEKKNLGLVAEGIDYASKEEIYNLWARHLET